MRWSETALSVLGTFTLLEAAALPPSSHSNSESWATARRPAVRNAHHIFNAVHSSMRQWGSSLHHNGMSLFLATVPAGTQFYHGSGAIDPVLGMEWLAFEPEHALMFAHQVRNSSLESDGPRPSERWDDMDRVGARGADEADSSSWAERAGVGTLSGAKQTVIHGDDTVAHRRRPPRDMVPGWLHTYRTKDVLPLLYIDGMSAGKSEMGTLDTQDALLLNWTARPGGAFREYQRAQELCALARDTWHGKIKGFIRMECGFEIILCSFAESVDFVRAVRAGHFVPRGAEPPRGDGRFNMTLYEEIRAVAARYDGIGGGRVRLDYDHFVTSFQYDLDLFATGGPHPRLQHLSVADLDPIRAEVDVLVNDWSLGPASEWSHGTNWQAIADMVVERYAKPLKALTSAASSGRDGVYTELETLLRVFVDADARNASAEVDRCLAQMVPASAGPSVAEQAIRTVLTAICSTLFSVYDVRLSRREIVARLQSLIDDLNWSTWKRCPACPLDQICFVPMWPFGAVEDYEHPQCQSATSLVGRMGYWSNFSGSSATDDWWTRQDQVEDSYN